jgi:hypothetical protein
VHPDTLLQGCHPYLSARAIRSCVQPPLPMHRQSAPCASTSGLNAGVTQLDPPGVSEVDANWEPERVHRPLSQRVAPLGQSNSSSRDDRPCAQARRPCWLQTLARAQQGGRLRQAAASERDARLLSPPRRISATARGGAAGSRERSHGTAATASGVMGQFCALEDVGGVVFAAAGADVAGEDALALVAGGGGDLGGMMAVAGRLGGVPGAQRVAGELPGVQARGTSALLDEQRDRLGSKGAADRAGPGHAPKDRAGGDRGGVGPWGTMEREVPLSPRLGGWRCETCGGAAASRAFRLGNCALRPVKGPARFAPARSGLPLTVRCASPIGGDGHRGATTCGNRPSRPSGWRSPCAFRRDPQCRQSPCSAQKRRRRAPTINLGAPRVPR